MARERGVGKMTSRGGMQGDGFEKAIEQVREGDLEDSCDLIDDVAR